MGLSPAVAVLSMTSGWSSRMPCPGPATPGCMHPGLGWCAFARHYSRNRCLFPFLRVLRCFTSPGVAPCGLSLFIRRRRMSPCAGFSHSETSGSKPVDGFPEIFAVFRVLRRHTMPRHPSCARIRLARNSRLSLRCISLQYHAFGFQRTVPEDANLEPGGPDKNRTCDLVLIRDAL